MSRWSVAVQVKVKRSSGDLLSQNKCPKMCTSALLWPSWCHALGLQPQPVIFPPPPPHPSPASALLDNTPSIWRWGTTHVHSKTTSIRERIVLYLLWVKNTSVFVFVFFSVWTLVHFFMPGYSYFYYILRPSKLGQGVKGRGVLRVDQSVTFQLQG